MPVMAGRSGVVPPVGDLMKPDGTPTFNSGHSLASGMLFCGLDPGDGTVIDMLGTEVALFDGPDVLDVVQTANGKAIRWPGIDHDATAGYGYIAPDTAAIRTASRLANQGTGAGYTFACTCMLFAVRASVGPIGETIIFGRPANAWENTPFINWALSVDPDTSNVRCRVNDNNVGGDGPTAVFNAGLNTFAALVGVAENTSAGVASLKFYANGALIGTKTGLVVENNQASNETQMMVATVYHVDTTHNYVSGDCAVYMDTFSSRPWSGAEVASWSAAPYQFLDW